MIKTHISVRYGVQHGMRQSDDTLQVVSLCCGRFLNMNCECKRCGERVMPADERPTWGPTINLAAPKENLETWIQAWTGLDVNVEVEWPE